MAVSTIKKQIALAVDMEHRTRELNASPAYKKTRSEAQTKYEAAQRTLKRSQSLYDSLYQSYVEQLMTEQEYVTLKARYKAEADEAEQLIATLEQERQIMKATTPQNRFLAEFQTYCGTETKVIASGLTWEHNYAYSNAFGKKAMSDLFMYAISISNADVNMRPPVALSVVGNDEMLSDEELDITATIKNIGESEAENIRLWIVRPNELDLTETSGERTLEWDTLDVGNSKQAYWTLKLKDNIEVTEYETYVDIGIKLEYTIPETGEKETKEIIIIDVMKCCILRCCPLKNCVKNQDDSRCGHEHRESGYTCGSHGCGNNCH